MVELEYKDKPEISTLENVSNINKKRKKVSIQSFKTNI